MTLHSVNSPDRMSDLNRSSILKLLYDREQQIRNLHQASTSAANGKRQFNQKRFSQL
jgi:hypothetical protein